MGNQNYCSTWRSVSTSPWVYLCTDWRQMSKVLFFPLCYLHLLEIAAHINFWNAPWSSFSSPITRDGEPRAAADKSTHISLISRKDNFPTFPSSCHLCCRYLLHTDFGALVHKGIQHSHFLEFVKIDHVRYHHDKYKPRCGVSKAAAQTNKTGTTAMFRCRSTVVIRMKVWLLPPKACATWRIVCGIHHIYLVPLFSWALSTKGLSCKKSNKWTQQCSLTGVMNGLTC